MINKRRIFGALICIVIGAGAILGCSSDDNRQPTEAEVKAADVNRQKVIDNLNVPEEQKAQMRAHMGGPAATNPADAARANAASAAGASGTSQSGRRN